MNFLKASGFLAVRPELRRGELRVRGSATSDSEGQCCFVMVLAQVYSTGSSDVGPNSESSEI